MDDPFRQSQMPLVCYQSENELNKPILRSFSLDQNYSSQTTCILQQIPNSFQQFWSIVKAQYQFKIIQAKTNQKIYHEDKKKSLFQHLSLSLDKNQKQGIFYLLINNFWIPYVQQKLLIQLTVLSENWLDILKTDFNDFVNIVMQLLKQFQYEPQIRTVQKTIPFFFFQKITTFSQWKQISELMSRIMSRKRNILKKYSFITAQIFQLSKSKLDFTFRQQRKILKDIYCVPSILIKMQQIKVLHQIIIKNYQLESIRKVLEYCLLLVGIDGFSQMFKYLLLFGEQNQNTDFLQTLKIIADNLYSRDNTGFTNLKVENKINQKVISKRAWKFVFDSRCSLYFIHHTKVFHEQCTWQTITSWNQLNCNCQIPFSIKIKHNFIKFGIVFRNDQKQQEEQKYMLCVSSGRFYKNKQVTKYQSFRKNPVIGLSLKVQKVEKMEKQENVQTNKISWIVKDQQGQKQVVSIDMVKMDKVKVHIAFKRGEIQVFPQQ